MGIEGSERGEEKRVEKERKTSEYRGLGEGNE